MFVFHDLAEADPDFHVLARRNVGQRGRKQVIAMLLDEAGALPLFAGALEHPSRVLFFAHLALDDAFADGDAQFVDRRAIGQREYVAPFGPDCSVVGEALGNRGSREQSGNANVDVGGLGDRSLRARFADQLQPGAGLRIEARSRCKEEECKHANAGMFHRSRLLMEVAEDFNSREWPIKAANLAIQ